jgi:hypothetical protein
MKQVLYIAILAVFISGCGAVGDGNPVLSERENNFDHEQHEQHEQSEHTGYINQNDNDAENEEAAVYQYDKEKIYLEMVDGSLTPFGFVVALVNDNDEGIIYSDVWWLERYTDGGWERVRQIGRTFVGASFDNLVYQYANTRVYKYPTWLGAEMPFGTYRMTWYIEFLQHYISTEFTLDETWEAAHNAHLLLVAEFYEGVIIEVTDVSSTGMALTVRNGTPARDIVIFTYSGPFMERLTDGFWFAEPYSVNEAGMVRVQYLSERVPNGQSVDLNIEWDMMIGTLSPGRYRIFVGVTECWMHGQSVSNYRMRIPLEFDIG